MKISMVAAMAKHRVIGAENRIPWKLPADMAHFKSLTLGHPVIMGEKTYHSIGRPLPGRTNIVISETPGFDAPGCTVAPSLADALGRAEATGAAETFIIGGGYTYAQALPHAETLHLTFIDAEIPGDTFFPEFNLSNWRLTASEAHRRDAENPFDYAFQTYERIAPKKEGR